MTAGALIRAGVPAACLPWPRHELSQLDWRAMADALPAEPGLHFIALWADTQQVHALFHAGAPLIASVSVEAGLYAALSPARPAAALFERAVADLWGHQAADAVDTRPWLDLGVWPLLRPMSDRPAPNAGAAELPELRQVPGALDLGPLVPGSGGVGGPALWRLGMDGAVIASAEARLGYGHRGALALMRGKSVKGAARIAARIAGHATVAHGTAFARAAEAALGALPPVRAVALRTAMLAIERVAVTLQDEGSAPGAAVARERVLQACAAVFGHRLMLGVVSPGGLEGEMEAAGLPALTDALAAAAVLPVVRRAGAPLGLLAVADALAWAPGGIAGRASGVQDPVAPGAAVDPGGTSAARWALRRAALRHDAALALDTLAALPDGQIWTEPGHAAGEGLGVAVGPHGRVWHWVRLAGGVVSACFAVDPAWRLLPVVERALPGPVPGTMTAAVDDVAASFGFRAPGMDL